MTTWDADDYPLPEWAEKRSNGDYMEVGAQLATRDGRRTGNAYVDQVVQHKDLGTLAVVITDMGNAFRMTQVELEEVFYPPVYVMRINEARTKRGVNAHKAKLVEERDNLRIENDALRAKIAEMERQEPVAEWLPLDSGEDTRRD